MQFDQRKRRREFVMLLGGMAVSSVAWPFAMHAQQVERMRHVIEIRWPCRRYVLGNTPNSVGHEASEYLYVIPHITQTGLHRIQLDCRRDDNAASF